MTSIPTSRRSFLKRLIAAGIVLGGGFSVWEAHHAVVERVEVRLKRLPEQFDGFTIAQLTDLHFNEYLHESYFQGIVSRVNELRPDLAVLTGDYISAPLRDQNRIKVAQEWAPRCAATMSRLRAKEGVFAVLGNHDHYCSPKIVTNALQEHGITVMLNDAKAFVRNDARLWLCGADSCFGRNYHPSSALRKAATDECKVVILHEPDRADDVTKLGADFMMAGHSHGGQIRIPLLGAPVLPREARKYPIGLRPVQRMQLYTSRGVGVIHLPMRFHCPPEISFFTLRRG